MPSRTRVATAIVLLGALGLACGSARDVSSSDRLVVTGCTECHGGGDNLTGAPPFDLSGRSSPALPSVGAHTAHVQLTAASLAQAYDCSACHPKPATVNAALHMDGKTQITFDATGTHNGTLSPGYNEVTRGCSNTYCHTTFPGGNAWNTPFWNVKSSGACGTCHGYAGGAVVSLPSTHLALAAGSTNATCAVCHPSTVKANGTIDVAAGKHVDGVLQFDATAIHTTGWMVQTSPAFHGNVALQDSSPCFRCHAWDQPAKVTTVTCMLCHFRL